jgi:N-acetyl-anhydromuramyl-L-alanine amidase AmpD
MPSIINTDWKWAYGLARRDGKPREVILHHAAATTLTPAQLHRIHLNNRWAGVGYHFYVRKSGAIYRGRPIWAIGAHAPGHNASIGICAEGNYDNEQTMPPAQLASLRWLVERMRHSFPGIIVLRHRDVTATACPGRHYPTAKVKTPPAKTTGKYVRVAVPKKKPAWWARLTAWRRATS